MGGGLDQPIIKVHIELNALQMNNRHHFAYHLHKKAKGPMPDWRGKHETDNLSCKIGGTSLKMDGCAFKGLTIVYVSHHGAVVLKWNRPSLS